MLSIKMSSHSFHSFSILLGSWKTWMSWCMQHEKMFTEIQFISCPVCLRRRQCLRKKKSCSSSRKFLYYIKVYFFFFFFFLLFLLFFFFVVGRASNVFWKYFSILLVKCFPLIKGECIYPSLLMLKAFA